MPGTQPPRAILRVVLGSPTGPYGRDPASSSERRCSTRAREASVRPPESSPPPHPQVPRRTHRGSGRSGNERLRAASPAEQAYSPRGGRRRARRRLRAAWRGHCEALAGVFRWPAGAEPAAPPQRLSTAPPPPMRGRGPPLNANGRGPGACALGARRGSARAGRPSGGRLGGTRLGGRGRAWGAWGRQGWRQGLPRAGTRGRPAASGGGWGALLITEGRARTGWFWSWRRAASFHCYLTVSLLRPVKSPAGGLGSPARSPAPRRLQSPA